MGALPLLPSGDITIRKPERPIAPIRQDTKEYRVAAAFLRGQRLTRGKAWERISDSCLNTTVSVLKIRHGIEIDSEWIDVPTRHGEATRVKRYWLADSPRFRLLAALGTEVRDAL